MENYGFIQNFTAQNSSKCELDYCVKISTRWLAATSDILVLFILLLGAASQSLIIFLSYGNKRVAGNFKVSKQNFFCLVGIIIAG